MLPTRSNQSGDPGALDGKTMQFKYYIPSPRFLRDGGQLNGIVSHGRETLRRESIVFLSIIVLWITDYAFPAALFPASNDFRSIRFVNSGSPGSEMKVSYAETVPGPDTSVFGVLIWHVANKDSTGGYPRRQSRSADSSIFFREFLNLF